MLPVFAKVRHLLAESVDRTPHCWQYGGCLDLWISWSNGLNTPKSRPFLLVPEHRPIGRCCLSSRCFPRPQNSRSAAVCVSVVKVFLRAWADSGVSIYWSAEEDTAGSGAPHAHCKKILFLTPLLRRYCSQRFYLSDPDVGRLQRNVLYAWIRHGRAWFKSRKWRRKEVR